MRKTFFILFMLLLSSAVLYSQQNEDKTQWKHFVIFAYVSDGGVFKDIDDCWELSELYINQPEKRYQIDVNYHNKVWGDSAVVLIGRYDSKNLETDRSAMGWNFSEFPQIFLKGLIFYNEEQKHLIK